MNDIAVSIENISKKYIIGHRKSKSIAETASSFFNYFGNGRQEIEEFWALKDISFDVNRGDAIGIIGRNGAGKSTLLKILSRITEPTIGRFEINGRVSSLLEVGTGFHPELTGRENIFLNGTILGMKRMEIRKKFDEIVDFSGVEKFLDTPVKRYSSGMYVRLAFAVAAHLEPEILIIDEVLAVGDVEFQKKCLGKMNEVTKSGRTVIFVSHDMTSIKSLCSKCILLDQGYISLHAKTLEVVNKYLSSSFNNHIITGNGSLSLVDLKIMDDSGNEIHTFNTFDNITFVLDYQVYESLNDVTFAICFNNSDNTRVTSIWSAFRNQIFKLEKGKVTIRINVNNIKLNPDTYELIIYAESRSSVLERIDNFRKIVVGYTQLYDLVKLPTADQGYYVEDFNFTLFQ